DLRREYLRWFDHWLKGIDNGVGREPLVKIFLMGEDRWLEGNTYPLEGTKIEEWYLSSDGHANTSQGDGRLTPKKDDLGRADRDTYVYDPGDPTPDPGFEADAEPKEDSAHHEKVTGERRDILVYKSDPLTKPLTFAGPLSAVLYSSTSA